MTTPTGSPLPSPRAAPPTASPVAMPKIKLGARDAEKVEKGRARAENASKLELSALREQIVTLETKQETDRALVEQLPEVMTELAQLREAVAGMESNERGLNSEIERLKQAPLPDAAPKVVAPPLTVSVDGPAERKVFELRRVDTSFTVKTIPPPLLLPLRAPAPPPFRP